MLALPSAPAALLSGTKCALSSIAAIRAWPWAHGASGGSAFLVTEGGAVLEHAAPPPHWQGLAAAGVRLEGLEGWRVTR